MKDMKAKKVVKAKFSMLAMEAALKLVKLNMQAMEALHRKAKFNMMDMVVLMKSIVITYVLMKGPMQGLKELQALRLGTRPTAREPGLTT